MDKLKKIMNFTWKYVPFMILIVLCFTDVSFADNKQQQFVTAWRALMNEYKIIINGVIGLGIFSSMLIFIVHTFQLASLGSAHPTTRRKILNNIMISGVCTALLGGVGIVYWILYTTVFFG